MSVIDSYRRSVSVQLEEMEETIRRDWFAYVLLVPTIGSIALIMWIPFFRGVYISFFDWPLGAINTTFVGLSNYQELFGMPRFRVGLIATLVYMTSTVAHLVLGILAAVLIANLNKFKALFSVVFLLGYTLPPVTTGVLWRFLLNPDFGAFFNYLTEFGFISAPIYWSVNGTLAQFVITAVSSWTFWPFVFLIVLATRESIPPSHYESAKIYGANTAQLFGKVTFPQLKTAILIALILRILNNFGKVGQPFILTGGGPGYDTSIVGVLLYRFAWEEGRLGMAYAMGMVMFVISLSAIILFVREFERESDTEVTA